MRRVGLAATGCDFRPAENLSKQSKRALITPKTMSRFTGAFLLASAESKSKAMQLAPIQSTAFTPRAMASADELTERGRGGDHVGDRAGWRGCEPDRHLLGTVQRHPARPSVHRFLREDEGRAGGALALGGDSGLTAALVSPAGACRMKDEQSLAELSRLVRDRAELTRRRVVASCRRSRLPDCRRARWLPSAAPEHGPIARSRCDRPAGRIRGPSRE